MTSIIGIVGFQGSGKDTVGNFLIDDYGYTKDSFAASLKDATAAIFGWDRTLLEGTTAESRQWREQPDVWWETRLDWPTHAGRHISERFTPRAALQLMGTDVLRLNFCNELWIHSLSKRLEMRRTLGEDVVITDCRFPNEIRAIKDAGGIVIRVKRGPEPEWYQIADAANSNFTHAPECAAAMEKIGVHISEWAWIGSDFDILMENNGTLQELKDQVAWTVSPK